MAFLWKHRKSEIESNGCQKKSYNWGPFYGNIEKMKEKATDLK